jgi:hypothetical protein
MCVCVYVCTSCVCMYYALDRIILKYVYVQMFQLKSRLFNLWQTFNYLNGVTVHCMHLSIIIYNRIIIFSTIKSVY